jgi:hypothetical protein
MKRKRGRSYHPSSLDLPALRYSNRHRLPDIQQLFHLRPVNSNEPGELVHIRRHAAHGADASDQLCIPVISLGVMPAGACSKDALQSFHHLVSQAALTIFAHHSPPHPQDHWFLT